MIWCCAGEKRRRLLFFPLPVPSRFFPSTSLKSVPLLLLFLLVPFTVLELNHCSHSFFSFVLLKSFTSFPNHANFTETSSSARVPKQGRLRRLNTRIQICLQDAISTESVTIPDSDPQIPSIIQFARCKSTISSLFISSSSPLNKKKSISFRGLGCTVGASQQVSMSTVVRTSTEWEEKKVKKKKSTP